MARNRDSEEIEVYQIPHNFKKDGYMFQGSVKTRHLVEGAILALAVGLSLWSLPIQNWSVRLSVSITAAMPFLLLGVMGIDGDPLSVFVINAFHWFESKRIMIFNGHVAPFCIRPVELTIAQAAEKTTLQEVVGALKPKTDDTGEKRVLIEGRDFVFEEDADTRKLEAQANAPAERRTRMQRKADRLAEKIKQKEAKKAAKAKRAEPDAPIASNDSATTVVPADKEETLPIEAPSLTTSGETPAVSESDSAPRTKRKKRKKAKHKEQTPVNTPALPLESDDAEPNTEESAETIGQSESDDLAPEANEVERPAEPEAPAASENSTEAEKPAEPENSAVTEDPAAVETLASEEDFFPSEESAPLADEDEDAEIIESDDLLIADVQEVADFAELMDEYDE